MSLKGYLLLMSAATGLCWLAFAVVLFFIDPENSGKFGFVFFYASLLLSLIGFLALIGLFVRSRFSDLPLYRQVSASFRQAIWFSGLIVFLLFLQGLRVLRWWNIVLFILFLAILEFLFISHRSSRGNRE